MDKLLENEWNGIARLSDEWFQKQQENIRKKFKHENEAELDSMRWIEVLDPTEQSYNSGYDSAEGICINLFSSLFHYISPSSGWDKEPSYLLIGHHLETLLLMLPISLGVCLKYPKGKPVIVDRLEQNWQKIYKMSIDYGKSMISKSFVFPDTAPWSLDDFATKSIDQLMEVLRHEQ